MINSGQAANAWLMISRKCQGVHGLIDYMASLNTRLWSADQPRTKFSFQCYGRRHSRMFAGDEMLLKAMIHALFLFGPTVPLRRSRLNLVRKYQSRMPRGR